MKKVSAKQFDKTLKKVFLILILIVFVFGCPNPPQPPETLPADFEVSYDSGATHLEWGHYELSIDSQGKAVFEKTMETALSKKYEFDVSESERKKIFDAVVINNFFGLNDNYNDPSIMDGGFTKISIKANGKRKTVLVVNSSVDQFDKVENEIGRLITHKIGEEAFSFQDLMDEYPEKEIPKEFYCIKDDDCAECSNSECSNKDFVEEANCPGNRCGTYIKECKCVSNYCTALLGNSFEDSGEISRC